MANIPLKRKREIARRFNSIIKNPVFDMGEYGPVYFQFNEKTGRLEYGDCTNSGFCACGGIDYDDTMSLDCNILALYDKAESWARANA